MCTVFLEELKKEKQRKISPRFFRGKKRGFLPSVGHASTMQIPGGDRHFPRPQSPRHRRSTTIATAMSVSGSEYMSGSEQMAARSPEQGRNVRRRTSVHSLPPPPVPMAMSGPPNAQGYSAQTYARAPPGPQPAHYQPGSTTLPSPLGGVGLPGSSHLPPPPPPPSQAQHLGTSTLMQAPPQTGPWNPYAGYRHAQPPKTQS